MIELTHYENGKKKGRYHTVGMVDKTEFGLESFDFSYVLGHGENYDEALDEFKKEFSKKMERLKAFESMLFKTDALVPIEIDCVGKPIK